MEIEWNWIAWHRKKKTSALLNVDRDLSEVFLCSFYPQRQQTFSRAYKCKSIVVFTSDPSVDSLGILPARNMLSLKEVSVSESTSCRRFVRIEHKTGKRLNHEPSKF